MVYVPMPSDKNKSGKKNSVSQFFALHEDLEPSAVSQLQLIKSRKTTNQSSGTSAQSLRDRRSKKLDQPHEWKPTVGRPTHSAPLPTAPPTQPPKETKDVPTAADKKKSRRNSVSRFFALHDEEEPPTTRASISTSKSTQPSQARPSRRVAQPLHHFPAPPSARRKTYDNLMVPSSKSVMKENLKKKLKELKKEPPPKPARTYRIWHPKTNKKTMSIKVGETGNKEDSNPFDLKNIHTISYETWKKQAKLQLPSAGGPEIETLEEVINVVPAIQKEGDQKVIDNTIRRLSILSNEGRGRAQKSIPTVSTRTPPTSRGGSTTSSDLDLSDESAPHTVVDVDSDEDAEKELRKMAGVDIKGKLKALKEFNEHLTHKRLIRQQLVQKATGHTVMDAENIPIKEHLLYLGEYAHGYIHDFFHTLTFWDRSIVEVNGRFGVVAASYFTWLRRIVVLNAIGFITTLLTVIIPQYVGDADRRAERRHSAHNFSILAVFHGEHSLHRSYLFYSGYLNRNEEHHNPFRNPAVRFLLAMIIIYLYNVFFIFSRINKFYSGIRMESKVSGFAHNQHFIGIMCGWDFSCGDPRAALFLRKTIHRELHILANATNMEEKHALRIGTNKKHRVLSYLVMKFGLTMGSFLMHFFSNTLLLGCCFALGLILHKLCDLKLHYFLKCISIRDDDEERTVEYDDRLCPNGDLSWEGLVLSLPAIFSVVATQSLCLIIGVVGDMESWATTERKVYATMMRAGLLYGTNLQVFYWFWATRQPLMIKEGFTMETIFGKELYRLVVMQGVLDITVHLGVRKLYDVIRSRDPKYKRPEFPTEYHALNMFYLHSIAQMSTMFSPGLSLFITIRLVLDFYRHRYTLFELHGNENYISHASLVYGPYLVTYFISFILVSFMNIFYLSETQPSPIEGPFRTYKRYDQALYHLVEEKKGLSWLRYLAGSGFLSGLLALLIALVYFNWQWSKAYHPIISQLNDQIFLERSDREVLLKAIFEIGRATNPNPEGADRKPLKRVASFTDATATSSNLISATSTDGYTSSAMPTSTDVSGTEGYSERRGSVYFATPPQSKQDKKEFERLLNQVKGGDNPALAGLEKIRRTSVTVDTWNAQRHRRDVMEKIVKGIVGARRQSLGGLAYDPTSKIFATKDQKSPSASSNSSNQSTKPKVKRATTSSQLSKLVLKTTKSTVRGKKKSPNELKVSRSQRPGKGATGQKNPPAKSKSL